MGHTPGEWKRRGTEVWAGHRRICFGKGSYDVKDAQERDANLALVAAAPAMLAALKRLFRLASQNDCGGCISMENACREAQEAITAAEEKA